MIQFFNYLVISTICLSVCYGIYLILFRNEAGFVYLRAFLLSSMFISLLVPLSPVSFDLANHRQERVKSEVVAGVIGSERGSAELQAVHHVENHGTKISRVDIARGLLFVYLAGVLAVIIWIFSQLFQILKLLFTSKRKKHEGFRYVINKNILAPFSFFSIIFLPEELDGTEESNIVVRHETIHVSELHSLDMLLANLLAAFMWFNPLVWQMRSSIQLVHEYLADEGTLVSGINRNVYMTLILNRATEGRLIPLYSGFNRSLIKKRMIMLTKRNAFKRNNYKIVALIPLVLFMLFTVACVNGSKERNNNSNKDVTLAVETVKMNVVYLGVDNPVIIAANGIDQDNFEVSIDNGKIRKEGDQYLITPARSGSATVEIIAEGSKIGSREFRVLNLVSPQAFLVLNNKRVGSSELLSIQELVVAEGIIAEIPDFIFDVDFRITGFQIEVEIDEYVVIEESGSDKITSEQRELLKRLGSGDIVIFDEIRAIGPDGVTRSLNPLEFKIE